jgi:hypothetical protein
MQLRPSYKKLSVKALLCAAIAALGFWATFSSDSFNALLGLVVVVFFGFTLLYLLITLIRPIERWELTPAGITSHAFGKTLTIRWDDLEELAFWRYGRLGEKKVYIKTRPGRQRAAREPMYERRVKAQSGYHEVIVASQFSLPAEEFFELLQHYWKDEAARAELASGAAPLPSLAHPQESTPS